MKKILMASVFVFLALTALAFAGDYEDGVAAYGKKDYLAALQLFKRSYAAGDVRAANYMGLMYRDGAGVAMDKKEAKRWLKFAAEKGNADAQYHLGVMYLDDDRRLKKHYKENSEAYRLIRKAAEQGHAQAQFRLGEMYENGEEVPQSRKEAFKWYAASANAGFADAEYNLGISYLTGWAVPKDVNEAVKWFAMAAEGGKDEAAFDLGVMYKNGERVPRDYAEALRWFRMMADRGSGEAKCYIAEMYAAGRAVEKDTAMAKKLLTEGRGLGGEHACERVAGRYGLGDSVARALDYEDGVATYGKKDYAAALRFFKRSYAGGDLRAADYLGRMYREGAGVKEDTREAIEWFRIAAEEGNADAQMSLGGLYEGWADNKDEGAKWELLAAKQGLADAQYYIGIVHLYGYKNGVNDPKGYNDPVEALRWFKLAADHGNTNAQDAIGSMYLNGWGTAEDHNEAYKWFLMAADKGSSESKCSLAKMYATGDTVEKDMPMAKKLFDEGQALGGGIGCDKIGWGYGLDKKDSAGYGTLVEEVKKDLVKPDEVKRLRSAADGGNGEAKCKLARLYAIGSGVETDMPRASKLFNEGVALGGGDFCNRVYEELKQYFIDIRQGTGH